MFCCPTSVESVEITMVTQYVTYRAAIILFTLSDLLAFIQLLPRQYHYDCTCTFWLVACSWLLLPLRMCGALLNCEKQYSQPVLHTTQVRLFRERMVPELAQCLYCGQLTNAWSFPWLSSCAAN